MKRKYGGLHVLVDDDARWENDPIAQAEAACAGGACVIQLRAKHAPDRQILHWARRIRRMTREAGALFILNDRFDLALLAEADAVHVGQGDLPPTEIRRAVGTRLDVGLSTHDSGQAVRALDEGADYVGFGPVFGTGSKETPYEARGLEGLAEVVRTVAPLPVVAIGGIDASHVAQLHSTGAAGIAVISAVAAAPDPAAATRALARAFATDSRAPA